MRRWLLLVCILTIVNPLYAFKPFKVSDIRIEGLQRISAGTVFNYLPVRTGRIFNQRLSTRAIRALYKTGFFKDVKIQREGTVLVIVLVERPSIASIKVEGNKDVETELLNQNFKKLGFVQGRVFNKSMLDKIEQELRRVYFSEGKYGVKIKTTVTPMPRNRVAIEINISEGKAAKIRKINIVGNRVFKTRKLLKQFTLRTPGAFTFYSKHDQYSKQKLGGDLEALKSYYHDRGYLEFRITSTQVSISADRKDIYITINIHEGPQYKVGQVRLAGRLVVDVKGLKRLIIFNRGDVYSRKRVTETIRKIKERLAENGYAFARVNPIPKVDRKKQKVGITLFVDPGRRVYVRRIIMTGNLRTSDIVMRREMRQMEGSWYSAKAVKRSKVRLQKTGFFTSVEVKTKAVAGTNDQVDIIFKVTEKPSGNFLASVGYSQTSGFIFQTSVVQDNFLGTGKRVGITLNTSDVNEGVSLTYSNPYYTKDGVSRGFTLTTRKTDAEEANLAFYATDESAFSINYGIPLTEYNRLRFSIGAKRLDVVTTATTPTEILDFINQYGASNDTYVMSIGWSHDTRNKAFFADSGVLHRVTAEVALPGGDLQYYKIRYRHHRLIKLSKRFTFAFKGEVAYGEGYDQTLNLPFYENFFAGGVKSVRGYEDNTLGPRDSNNRPIGGALKTTGSLEFIFPPPFAADSKAFRVSAFVDFGNVFADKDSFDSKELRASAGLSIIWISPIGPMTISFAAPLNEKDGDEVENVQFSLGGSF